MIRKDKTLKNEYSISKRKMHALQTITGYHTFLIRLINKENTSAPEWARTIDERS